MLSRIFLFVGLLTVVSAPLIYWKLDNDIPSARFLTEHERLQAIERLRGNKTGTGSREFRWGHVLEALLEPKTYLWVSMSLLLNVGASVTGVFGPLILSGLGYDKYTTSLLNMPFGAVQIIIILLSSYAAQKIRVKSAVLAGLVLPVITGLAVMYTIPRTNSQQAPLLVAYYLLAFMFGGNPLIVAWIVGNTGGTTKKSINMSIYNAGSAAGNIIGPILFHNKDAPEYKPGLRAVLGIFVALVAVIALQVLNLKVLNKLHQRSRVQAGKQAVITDHSMRNEFAEEDQETEVEEGRSLGDNAFLDLTDRRNNEFVYIY